MTIKKRLFWSNIFMILVPVIATALIGLACVGFIWIALIHGVGVGIHDQEEFDLACAAISETTEYNLKKDTGYSVVERLLDSNDMAIRIYSGSDMVYSYGKEGKGVKELFEAANLLEGDATLTQNGQGLYVHHAEINHTDYLICLSGGYHNSHSYSTIKMAVVVVVIIIVVTIVLSILLTNRFLTKFVLKRMEEPLDILANGVHELRDGNLDYRIAYDRKDEFYPVCEDFNEMAVRLKESVQKIQQQEQSRKELIAGISHDIRSPLTSIQAYVEGLIDGIAKTPEKQSMYLHTIKSKAEDLAHIVSQLFLFSKMELGEYPEHPSGIELDKLIAETVAGLEEEYKEKGLLISMELSPVTVYADSIQMQRIITNILENSLKYKKNETGHVEILLEKQEHCCQLKFSDDGPGVPEESVAHLFEVFYRSDPARQNPDKGSGLGLAIVASAVERMNGTIMAKNGREGGLEICINIPTGGAKDGENTDY